MSLRITGGTLRGRAMAAPARGVRPTGARVREALFAIWRDRLDGCRFLDLFAGSGIVGIEALSRGAAAAVFVEASPRVARDLRATLAALELSQATVRVGRLPAVLAAPAEDTGRFDLVFADPPYAFEAFEPLIASAAARLTPAGELAIEHRAHTDPGDGTGALVRFDRRAWGDTAVSRYRSTVSQPA